MKQQQLKIKIDCFGFDYYIINPEFNNWSENLKSGFIRAGKFRYAEEKKWSEGGAFPFKNIKMIYYFKYEDIN